MKQRRLKEIKERNRVLGKFVKRAFKIIDRQAFIVNVYSRAHRREGTLMFTYELIPYLDKQLGRLSKKSKVNVMRGYYQWNPTMMLNVGHLALYDYVMELLYVDCGLVKFRESHFDTFTKQESIDSASTDVAPP
jgi:hypothetical protein